MTITPQELATLNGYCASALFTARLLGRMGRRAQDLRLRLELARRANDALRHAGIWAETIRALGETPEASSEGVQARYEAHAGRPDTLLQALVMTQAFERRLARQLVSHVHEPGIHPIVRATLRRMIEEEVRPGWTARWLADNAGLGSEAIGEMQQRYAAADRQLSDLFDAWESARQQAA